MQGAFGIQGQLSRLNPYDYEELDIDATVKGFTTSKLADCKAMWVYFSGGDVRFRVDTNAASVTGSAGIPAFADKEHTFSGVEAAQFRATRDAGSVSNGKAHATFYK